jgi:hypothetical protein
MLTEFEAQKLRHDMSMVLNAAPGVVLACAVRLLIVVVLAVIGARTGVEDYAATVVLIAPAQPGAPQ